MGHPKLGIKMPKKMQNTIKKLNPRLHPGTVPSSMLVRPNPFQVPKRPNTHSAHGPTPEYGSSEASQTVGQSPPQSKPSSAELTAGPRRKRKLRRARDPPRRTGTVTHPLSGTGAFITNHSTAWCGCQTTSAATQHSGHDRSPIRQLRSLRHHSRRCAGLPCPART